MYGPWVWERLLKFATHPGIIWGSNLYPNAIVSTRSCTWSTTSSRHGTGSSPFSTQQKLSCDSAQRSAPLLTPATPLTLNTHPTYAPCVIVAHPVTSSGVYSQPWIRGDAAGLGLPVRNLVTEHTLNSACRDSDIWSLWLLLDLGLLWCSNYLLHITTITSFLLCG